MILDRLLEIVRTSASEHGPRFPLTEIFNEGWMLRLLLDAAERLEIKDHPLSFLPRSHWYSEALLASRFRPSKKGDPLGEGFTNADAVIGHFTFDAKTKAGLQLDDHATQFVVVEAKMFSNLSKGTKNAPLFDQAARNVACMAEAVARSGRALTDFEKLGFFVVAPARDRRSNPNSNLERCTTVESIRAAVHNRIAGYEAGKRSEAEMLRKWERDHLLPLIDLMAATGGLVVLSWEACIETIGTRDRRIGADLAEFYEKCLTFSPIAA